MNKNKYKPLDSYEKDLEKAIESTDRYTRPKNYKFLMADAIVTANNSTSKSKAINIRVAEKDLVKLKTRAEEIGIPYQTLINSLLHQYLKSGV